MEMEDGVPEKISNISYHKYAHYNLTFLISSCMLRVINVIKYQYEINKRVIASITNASTKNQKLHLNWTDNIGLF